MHLDTQTDVFTHYKIGEENNRIDVYGEHTHNSLPSALSHPWYYYQRILASCDACKQINRAYRVTKTERTRQMF